LGLRALDCMPGKASLSTLAMIIITNYRKARARGYAIRCNRVE